MEFPLSFALDGGSNVEGKGAIDEESLSLTSLGESLRIPLRDIETITPADYKVGIRLSNGNVLISGLGYGYEDFIRELCFARNELILKDMLGLEKLVMGQVKAECELKTESNEAKGPCELRVYETALVVLPVSGEVARFPFCEIAEVGQEGFSIIVSGEYGDKLTISSLGGMMDPFRKALSESMNALSLKAQKILKEAAPNADSLAITKAARLMRDGKAARRADLDWISPAIWPGLVKKIEKAGLGKEYEILEKITKKEQMCIGVKRSLMGDMEGEYIWILAPLKGRIALEATSEEESGRATYLFKASGNSEESLISDVRTINRCMIAINFRREPVYIGEDDPKYEEYRFSIARLPQLRKLRSMFIKRVIHNENWEKNLLGE